MLTFCVSVCPQPPSSHYSSRSQGILQPADAI